MRRYQHDARRTAAVIAGVNLADDAAQEAFVRAFGFLHRFRSGSPFRPWLQYGPSSDEARPNYPTRRARAQPLNGTAAGRNCYSFF